jgi:hypothetical protein
VERKIYINLEEISCVENISLLLSHVPPLLSISLQCGRLKSCVGARSTPLLHTIMLQKFQI